MANIESLIVELDAKVDKYNRNMQDARQKTGTAMGGISRNFKNTEKDIETFSKNGARALKGFAAAVAASLSVRALKNYADEWSGIQNRLKTVTNSTGELRDVTDKLFNSANDTRSSFESTATLYQRLTQATADMGFSQERTIALTEALNKSFAVGGATAQEQAGAIRQLAQALASGALRGDEFNSVSEQAPAIMDAIVAATGKTKGELRELAAEGKITAELLVQSVEAYAPVVDNLFTKSVQTIGQTNTKISNSFVKLIGKIDETAGVSRGYAEVGTDIAEALGGMDAAAIDVIDTLSDWGAAWKLAMEEPGAEIKELRKTFEDELVALQWLSNTTAEFAGEAFKDMPANLKDAIQITVTEIASFLSLTAAKVNLWYENLKAIIDLNGDGGAAAAAAARDVRRLEEVGNIARQNILDRMELRKEERDQILADIEAEREARRNAKPNKEDEGSDQSKPEPFINLDGEGTGDPALDKKISQLDNWLKRVGDANKTEYELLEEHYAQLNDLLHEKYAKDFVMTQEGEQALLSLDEKYAKAKMALDKKTDEEAVRSRQMAQKTMLGLLGNFSSGAQKIQQGLFAFEQAKSAAAILVSGAEGAEKAIGTMGPAGIPVAAGILAAAATLSSQTSGVSIGDTSLSAPAINTSPAQQPEGISGQFSISEGGTNNDRAVVMFQANAGDELGERLADWLNGQMKSGRIG